MRKRCHVYLDRWSSDHVIVNSLSVTEPVSTGVDILGDMVSHSILAFNPRTNQAMIAA